MDELRLDSAELDKFYNSEKINKSLHILDFSGHFKSTEDLTRKGRLKKLNYNSDISSKTFRLDCLGKNKEFVIQKSDCVYAFHFRVIFRYNNFIL